jgi:murein DD-endopeptidase MepM/ murein hydrolase activator NlpD
LGKSEIVAPPNWHSLPQKIVDHRDVSLTLTICGQNGWTKGGQVSRRVANRMVMGALHLFQRSEQGFGQAGLTATLSMNQAIALPPLREGLLGPVQAFFDRYAHIDLTPDLGADIGSRTWFRGLLTCTVLCSAAIALFPSYRPLPVAVPAPLSGDAWDESRAQIIAPQAWGSDTGKRMASTEAVIPLTDTPERPSIDLTASLGQGDGFARVLERAGVGGSEAQRIVSMVSDVTDLGSVKPGTAIKITLGRRASRNMARPLDFLAFRARIDLAVVVKRNGSQLVLERMPIAVDHTPLRIQGRVGESLYLSARAAGVPAKTVESYLRALASKISIGADMSADSKFDLVVEHASAATGETEVGKLLYAGLYRGSRKLQLLEWSINGRTEWYEASGVGQARGGMVRPVEYSRISSGFGMRFHPLLGYSRFHRGTDYAAPYGAPIRAVTDGVVAFAGRSGGYGNFVKLAHAGGLGSGYGHMSRIMVSGGQRVARGQLIGYVGSTGLSTGPHLHFEVYKGGQPVAPSAANFVSTSLLTGQELAQFRARLSSMLSLPTGAPTPAKTAVAAN